ncbi:PC4-domain-containing protein [Dothidotthia symphoricarpi CBS 119687]|uniref:PC4-domain-containing protein n=1 Tax=Dothidotthia symphoricarpi CBS 119687 TaxID=1392245 RepID=A0A6A5ZZD6_9PLEO|nr:PC4-domain-containing protein [Dothidotthia symphoricarpi CBS 119687]KAF2124117.1 PC4-domain-containing protein [Dothidotthia symphoricarpi CBS 119687]
MAGFKRGGARGGAPKKTFLSKKRVEPSDDEDRPARASKKAKADDEDEEVGTLVPKLEKDEEGNQYVALNTSGKRRATVSEFKANVYVNIREYYVTDAGESKPGKKGISLSIENYNALLAAAPLIESVLAKKGVEVVRPEYEGAEKSVQTNKEEPAEEDEEEEDVVIKADDEDEED